MRPRDIVIAWTLILAGFVLFLISGCAQQPQPAVNVNVRTPARPVPVQPFAPVVVPVRPVLPWYPWWRPVVRPVIVPVPMRPYPHR